MLIEIAQMAALGVVLRLQAQGILVEGIKQLLQPGFHVGGGSGGVGGGVLLLQQASQALLQGVQPLGFPGIKQMATALLGR